ncbi:MAG: hypothetical protein MI741_06255 [Rhodospirillales bacterium]|nr:hypothetical protein [Rhodospirillales bacterium]
MIRFITRLRFLPATIFAAALMLSVKMGNIWDGLDGMVDSAISIAGAEAQQPETEAPAALPPLPREAQDPDAPEGLTEETAEATDQGFEREPPARLSVDDPTLLTQAEIDLLQQLAERREVIEARERELAMREGLMQAAESRIDKKILELKTLQATVEELIANYDDQQTAKIGSLVKIYENMKPKDAARIFEQLDMDTLLLVAERMKERNLAAIMSDMDPGKARDVTVDLSKRRQLPGADG